MADAPRIESHLDQSAGSNGDGLWPLPNGRPESTPIDRPVVVYSVEGPGLKLLQTHQSDVSTSGQ